MESIERDDEARAVQDPTSNPSDSLAQEIRTGEDAGGLERDHDARAPETLRLGSGEHAPISISHDRINHNSEGPYVQNAPNEKFADTRPPELASKHEGFQRYKAIVAVLVVVIIGLVLGLAIGLTRNLHQQATAPAMPTSVPAGNTSSPQQVITDGSALAVASIDSGHKFAYFQGPSGDIRRAVYFNAAWSSIDVLPQSLTGLVANNTPLSLTVKPDGTYLYFFNKTNYLVEVQIQEGSADNALEVNTVSTTCDDEGAIAIKPGSRHLSASTITVATNQSIVYRDFILFEGPLSEAVLLYRYFNGGFSGGNCGSWENLTELLVSTLPSISLSPPFVGFTSKITFFPFYSSPSSSPSSTSPGVGLSAVNDTHWTAMFFNPLANSSQNLVYVLYNSSNNTFTIAGTPLLGGGLTANSPPFNISFNSTMFRDSDLVTTTGIDGYCVYGTNASSFTDFSEPMGSPPGQFPYPRLATLQSPNNNTNTPSPIYHQMNGTVLVEQVYDDIEQVWTSTEIDLANLPLQTPWTFAT